MLANPPPLIIGIAGGSGSGKTTLAHKIQEIFSDHAVLIAQDSYYKDLSHLSEQERGSVNFDHPDSIDFNLLCQNIEALKNGQIIQKPIYNFHTHTRESKSIAVNPASVIIIEGILILAVEELRDLLTIKIFVDTEDDVRLMRRIKRDMQERSRTLPSIEEQYFATVKPMHEKFVSPSRKYADIIVPEGGKNQQAIDMIVARIEKTSN